MRILETLVLAQNQRIFEDLSKGLSLGYTDTFNFPVYRLELAPQLVVLFYVISPELKVEKLLLNSILPHIIGVLMVSNRDSFDDMKFPQGMVEEVEKMLETVVSILAIENSENWNEQLPDYIYEKGLFLSERGRLLFWNKEDAESTLQIWKVAFRKLLR